MTLPVQFLSLGMMLGCGSALGIVFDIYRVLTGQLRIARWLIPFFDLVYWTAGTIGVFVALEYSNFGQVRIFVFLGLAIGVCFHFAFLSGPTVKLVLLAIRLVRAAFRLLLRILDVLIVTPILFVYKLFTIFIGFLAAVAIFLGKIVIQLTYPLWRLVIFAAQFFWRRVKWLSILVQAVKKGLDAIRRLFHRQS
ncbi:MAG: spore cortex biosynthesis protein YabQ [Paenibacillaceae bacterium]|uniref:spore cortex biosynthesis protein YabQ n=1 Tax=Paenibacillus cymbidii TaxID=1639034 RepID=UPI00107FD69D|nr:spore cortex biosynthesis protein YabQ [Paenibacillus cymbidii]MBO9605916.1 spore cortex biosynthesis protein YabQ [Paenibacillaceae bacterium]